MTLGELFSDIAKAIRTKDGTTAAIPATTFPERIMAISGGGGGNGGPFCRVTVESQGPHVANVHVNISTEVSVTVEDYEVPKTHALYNGVRLPKIPEDALAKYPYALIRNDGASGYYDLLLGVNPWYYANGNVDFLCAGNDVGARYRIAKSSASSATEWAFFASISEGNYYGIDTNKPVLWSNHDVPNGSATSTDIYFEGTDPVPTD